MVSHLEAMFPKGFRHYVSCITHENFFGGIYGRRCNIEMIFPAIKFEIE